MALELTPEKIEAQRKLAFMIGFMRYLDQSDGHEKSAAEKSAFGALPLSALLAAGLVGIPSYWAGRFAGGAAGRNFGKSVSPEDASAYQYELAGAATDRLIEELKAQKANKELGKVIGKPEEERTSPGRPFAGYL